MNFYQIFKTKNPIIGMIHLLPLPGYKDYPGMKVIINYALGELKALEFGGVDGVLIENEGDKPATVMANPRIIKAMIQVTKEVVKHAKKVVVGVEVLLNDPKASLKIAKESEAKFIRTDYFVDKMKRPDHGEMKINPIGLMKYKKKIGAEDILILTDIQVKHAVMVEKNKPIGQSSKEAIKCGSDGVIVTGNWTGLEPKPTELKEAKLAAGNFPVLVGSGMTAINATRLLKVADSAIVGTSFKDENQNICLKKVKRLIEKVDILRKKHKDIIKDN